MFLSLYYSETRPSITDTIGNQHFLKRGIPNSGAFGIFPVCVVCIIALLSTTWLHFESFTLLLTSAVMVDNLAENIDECPLNWGRQVLFAYNWDSENCPLYRVVCVRYSGVA